MFFCFCSAWAGNRGHRGQRPGERRERSASGDGVEPGESVLRAGRAGRRHLISANLFKRNWVRLCYTVASLTVVALAIQAATHMPAASGAGGFVLSEAGPVLGRPLLFLLGFLLFLYVSCEVGVWNRLPRHLIAQGIPESKALNILSLGFALGLLIGRVAVSPILLGVPAVIVTLASSVAMAVTTYLMLRTSKPTVAFVLVFIAGVSMAPVFPTTLAMVGTLFRA